MSNELLSKFQRQINRISDSDKATRKMGLKKLNDELPFTSKKERKNLQEVILEHLMKPLLYGISDSVEKCREYSLTIISKSIDGNALNLAIIEALASNRNINTANFNCNKNTHRIKNPCKGFPYGK